MKEIFHKVIKIKAQQVNLEEQYKNPAIWRNMKQTMKHFIC